MTAAMIIPISRSIFTRSRFFGLVVLCAGALACSKNATQTGDGGSPARTDTHTAADTGGQVDVRTAEAGTQTDAKMSSVMDASAEVQPAPRTCLDLRGCLLACAGVAACETRCIAQTPSAERMKFEAAAACSRKACPMQDVGCRCESECKFPSDCADLVDECTRAMEDPFCAATCT